MGPRATVATRPSSTATGATASLSSSPSFTFVSPSNAPSPSTSHYVKFTFVSPSNVPSPTNSTPASQMSPSGTVASGAIQTTFSKISHRPLGAIIGLFLGCVGGIVVIMGSILFICCGKNPARKTGTPLSNEAMVETPGEAGVGGLASVPQTAYSPTPAQQEYTTAAGSSLSIHEQSSYNPPPVASGSSYEDTNRVYK